MKIIGNMVLKQKCVTINFVTHFCFPTFSLLVAIPFAACERPPRQAREQSLLMK